MDADTFAGAAQGITKRNRSEDEVRFSERQLRSYIEHAGDAIYVVAQDSGRIIYCNQQACQDLGYTRDELLQMSAGDIETEMKTEDIERVHRSLDENPKLQLEGVHRRKDGTTFPVEINLSRLDGAETPTLLSLVRDITERKRAEFALAQTTELLERTAEMAKVGGWELDLRTNEVRYSKETARIHEVDSPDVVEKLSKAEQYYGPEAWPAVQAAVQAAITHGTPYDLESPFITAKGRHIWVRVQGFAELENGKAIRLKGTFQDITERKRAEEKIRKSERELNEAQALAKIGSWQVAFGAEGESWSGSAELYRLYGYHEGTPLDRQTGYDRMHPDDRKAMTEIWAAFLQGKRPGEWEHRIVVGGENKWLQVRARAHFDHTGRLHLVTGTNQDITERRLAEEKVRVSLLEKEALLKEVHHRVKNNMQVITSLLRLEAARIAQPGTKAVLNDMKNRILSMALLHESLYRTGTFALVDLGAYLTQLSKQSFRSLVTRPGSIRLQLDIASAQVELDQALPCGLLVNELISNCLKHGFPGDQTGEVRVELKPIDSGSLLRLRVSDTGVGLPADFEEKRGHSIGLQLVADLASQFGGRLVVGGGPAATFEVTFAPKCSKPSTPS